MTDIVIYLPFIFSHSLFLLCLFRREGIMVLCKFLCYSSHYLLRLLPSISCESYISKLSFLVMPLNNFGFLFLLISLQFLFFQKHPHISHALSMIFSVLVEIYNIGQFKPFLYLESKRPTFSVIQEIRLYGRTFLFLFLMLVFCR